LNAGNDRARDIHNTIAGSTWGIRGDMEDNATQNNGCGPKTPATVPAIQVQKPCEKST